jgi:two-component system cell cycle sensor histidine kinase PleC
VTLEFMESSTPAYAIVDERLMRQIILNLLSNALKFSDKDDGRVKLSFTASRYDGIEIRIEDNGMGISDKDIERVMRPFEQVESAYARKNGGAGLGLPLAVKLTELHDGSLAIESKENEGTTVHILLPASRYVDKPEVEPLRAAS